jgi:hypothetical protein
MAATSSNTEDLPDGIRQRSFAGTAVTGNFDGENDRRMSDNLRKIRSLSHASYSCNAMIFY